MKNTKEISRAKSLLFWVIGIFLILSILLIPAEIITRLVQKADTPYYKKAQLDDHLGWRTKAHYKADYNVSTLMGNNYKVHYRTGDHGFRPYGDEKTDRKKLFVLGDSYTQAVEANNGKTYASILANNLDAELFCYGQAGYGNLQEYLLLEQYIDRINPDLLLLQICGNDLHDNYADLEMHSGYTVGQKRPYIDLDGDIKRYYPIAKWQSIIDKSKFLKLIRMKIQTLLPAEWNDYGPEIWKKRTAFPPFKMSVDITDLILTKIKSKAVEADIPLVVFIAGTMEPYRGELIKICEKQNIPCLYEMVNKLKQKEVDGEDVTSSDGYHWTEMGHKFLADQMTDTIITYLRPQSIE